MPACSAVTCHLHFWQNDQDLSVLHATVVTILKEKSAQKVDPGEENYPATPAGIQTRDLSVTSPALTTELSMLKIVKTNFIISQFAFINSSKYENVEVPCYQ